MPLGWRSPAAPAAPAGGWMDPLPAGQERECAAHFAPPGAPAAISHGELAELVDAVLSAYLLSH